MILIERFHFLSLWQMQWNYLRERPTNIPSTWGYSSSGFARVFVFSILAWAKSQLAINNFIVVICQVSSGHKGFYIYPRVISVSCCHGRWSWGWKVPRYDVAPPRVVEAATFYGRSSWAWSVDKELMWVIKSQSLFIPASNFPISGGIATSDAYPTGPLLEDVLSSRATSWGQFRLHLLSLKSRHQGCPELKSKRYTAGHLV